MTKNSEVEEEIIEEEEAEVEKPRKKGGEYELAFDIEDLAVKEALKDVLAINEAIPKEPPVKSQELREFIDFKQECEALMELLKPYVPQDHDVDLLSEDFDIKKAMMLAKKLAGIDGKKEDEYINGEPSPYAQELFKKVWQKYIDCRWFFAMMKGKKPATPKDLKFAKPPEDLLKAEGEKI
jgi:hypothetical protein